MPSLAQSAPPPASSAREPAQTYLDRVRYDPEASGPLIWIPEWADFLASATQSARTTEVAETVGKETARQFAENMGCRLFAQGTLTVIAPRDQRVIADVPQKPADPFAKMDARERFSVFLSLLSREQWQAATGAAGIGVESMTEEQRTLWAGFLPPDKVTLQKNRVIPTENGGARYETEGNPLEFAPDAARLRLVRRVELHYQKMGADEYGYSSGNTIGVGDPETIYTGNVDYTPDQQRQTDGAKPVQAFGADVLRTVPNRPKPSDLDFGSPALSTAVALGASAETLGDLVGRVGKSLRLNLRCDRRVAGLKVYRRVAPEASVSAGDLLQAVCLGVRGTFRKIAPASGEPVYLLTHDREGIYTRFLRWQDWAQDADSKKYSSVQEAANKAAALDPLGMIGFAPDDPNALPPALLARVDAAYRRERYAPAPEMKMSELPPALRKEAKEGIEGYQRRGTTLKSDVLLVGTELTCQLLFPGGIAVEPRSYGRDFGGQYLQKIAVLEKPRTTQKATKPEPTEKPLRLPTTNGRRVLLLPFPDEADTAQKLLGTAARKGFGEVWLRVPLDSGKAAGARLAAAVKVGTKSGLRVGAVVDVLRGYEGTPDVNAFGETGTDFSKRLLTKHPDWGNSATRYAKWNVWNRDTIQAGLLPLASVPGLSAIALQATAAPGHSGVVHGGDGIFPGGHLGYTPEIRLACIEARGFDPIDVGDYSHTLGLSPEVGLFEGRELWDTLATFRWEQNKRQMALLHAALKSVAPKVPVYLNDRASSYASPNTTWYVRWTQADRIAVCPLYAIESEHRDAARSASPEALLNQWSWQGKSSDFARAVVKAVESARKWNGVVVDCSYLPPADVLRILGGIADSVP